MKKDWKKLALCIVIPLAVGGLAAWLTHGGMDDFNSLVKPPLSPPGWVFPAVWTILYILMGVASYLAAVGGAPKSRVDSALWIYGLQLCANLIWTLLFFGFKLYLGAFIWLLVLLALIAVNAVRFWQLRRAAGLLLAPYLLWVAFAGYLNMGIYLLNKTA